MKNLILFLLLSVAAYSQTVTYNESNAVISNPERGFYQHYETHSTGYSLLNQNSIVALRTNQNITLILRVYYLEDFRNSPISQAYLNNIQTDLTRVRSAGAKAIIRFAYNDGDSSGSDDAPKAVLLNHIQQLKPVMFANRDVIACFQGGFIGRWGEWYYSTNYGTSNLTSQNMTDRKEILQSIVDNFGIYTGRYVQVRTPIIKQMICGVTPLSQATAFANTNIAFIGAHDDAFCADTEDEGTFLNSGQYQYWASDNKIAPMGGESNQTSTFTSCTASLVRMKELSVDYLNIGYHPDVLQGWENAGCMTDYKKRLGYRFALRETTLTPTTIQIKVENTGFGKAYNARKCFLVFVDEASGAEISQEIPTDVRLWLKGSTVTLNQTIPALPQGIYNVYLSLPDPLLPNNANYAIQLANDSAFGNKGYNDLRMRIIAQGLGNPEPANPKAIVYINHDILTITIPFKKFVIYDMLGRKVFTGTQNNMDVSSLANGAYNVKIDDKKAIKLAIL